MATDKKPSKKNWGKRLIIWGLGIFLIMFSFHWIGENKSAIEKKFGWDKKPVQEKIISKTKQKSGWKREITLQPGENVVIDTNFRETEWKITDPVLVREVDGGWFGEWKEDFPGQQIRGYNYRLADQVEFWNHPDLSDGYPVTIVIWQR